MCIMMTDDKPSSTRLINIPIKIKNKKYKLLIYTNDLERNNNQIDNKNALMIVPIPNKYNYDDFGLLNINTKNMKTFRNKLFSSFVDMTISTNSISNSLNKINVHKIGNYNISVSPNINNLKNINWNRFNLPNNFQKRFNTLKDKFLYPHNFAYVIAQANKSVANDGFGVAYPDDGIDYFPTAHEKLKDIFTSIYYDVKCYNCFTYPLDKLSFGQSTNFPVKNLIDKDEIEQIFKHLTKYLVMSKNGNKIQFELNKFHECINYWEIKGYYSNDNIMIKSAT